MHRFFITCFLLLYTCCASAQKNIILSGTIQENGQLTPITLTLSISKDTITGICKTLFPVGTKNSEKTGTWPGSNALQYYQLGAISLAIGDARYKRITVPLTGYQVTDGFTLDIFKKQGQWWAGQFADTRAGYVVRKGSVSFYESENIIRPQVINKKPLPIKALTKPTSIKKDSVKRDTIAKIAPPIVTKTVDTFSKYQPLYRWSRAQVDFSVFDAFKEDGDVISWNLDGGEKKEITITNAPQQFNLVLSAGKVHTLTITLLKEGNERGNTPTIDLTDGSSKVHRDLSGDFGKIYSLYLLYNP